MTSEREDREASAASAQRAPDAPQVPQALAAILEVLPFPIAVSSLSGGQRLMANRAFRNLQGLDADPDRENDLEVTTLDGAPRRVALQDVPLRPLDLLLTVVHDHTLMRFTQQALRESEHRYAVMADASPVGIMRLDPKGLCHHVNRRWRELTGLTPLQSLGKPWYEAVHPHDRPQMAAQWEAARESDHEFRAECRFKRSSGETCWVLVQAERVRNRKQVLEGFIATVTDITAGKRTEEEIRQLAYYDPLTGLPNRTYFMEQLERALAVARRGDRRVVLLFCDLDNFKDVNDAHGHDLGDGLLQGIADRLSGCIRKGDILSRLGGDEFVLLLPRVSRDAEILAVAQKFIGAMAKPFSVQGHEIFAATSIGIAVYPDDGQDVATLLKHADLAMYAAKAEGRNRFQFYNEEMNRRIQQRTRLESGLRRALDLEEMSLVWQPQFSLRTGKLVGVEALLRWHSRDLGDVSPAHFIPLAEETGLIHNIGAWVLEEACRRAATWQKVGTRPVRVAVNLSGRQFMEPDLVERVMGILRTTGLDPSWLELEITESMLMHNAEAAQETLMTLRQGGVGLAIDDFGTGYSSLLYLRNYPVGRIKIAREFITDITTSANDAAIAGTVIAMANSLDMRALAEGVETEAQAEFLRALGCHEVQGFHFSRPLKVEAFESLLD
ncbi:EAL domain-containing protein [bacterium]|nr:EAL domain-containing protein [bacterium]PJA76507.1 MAG: two-component system response regulator [bacterium CG_4_9_14_3_um_filter_65_15]